MKFGFGKQKSTEVQGNSPKSAPAAFDAVFYLHTNSDVAGDGVDPWTHYAEKGWREGRDPSRNFSTSYYLDKNPDVRAEGGNPFLHYLQFGEAEGRLPKPVPPPAFDAAFYLQANKDVAEARNDPWQHYLATGWREGRDPSPAFSTQFYLDEYPDVREVGVNPFEHYLEVGKAQGRLTRSDQPAEFDAGYYLETYPDVATNRMDPWRHFRDLGWREGRDPSPAFSTQFYLDQYPDVRASGRNPFLHYIQSGKAEGRAPKMFQPIEFDTAFYLRRNRDVEAIGDAPWRHYYNVGWREGRDPSPGFSTQFYLEQNPDVRSLGVNPLLHFIEFGRAQGRLPAPAPPKEFDAAFYLETCRDAVESQIDPWRHYDDIGWRGGYDPSPHFSTKFYLDEYPDVSALGMNPFLHYVRHGKAERRKAKPEKARVVYADEQGGAVGIGYLRDVARDTGESREPDLAVLKFTYALAGMDIDRIVDGLAMPPPVDRERIDISIIVSGLAPSARSLECFKSIAGIDAGDLSVEVLFVDQASGENAFPDAARVKNLVYLRDEVNAGLGPALDVGASKSRGRYLFFIGADAQVAPDALLQLHKAIAADQSIAIVGPKILSFDGRLLEAGQLLDGDVGASPIGQGHDHRLPRFNYARRVECVSGSALFIEREDFLRLGGFESGNASDLCLQVRADGRSVFYAPEAVVARHASAAAPPAKSQVEKARIVGASSEIDIRAIAFYLPQFHPIPENDQWWGEGFTEWTNLVKAKPNYAGHRQPRVPADLGYYDLRSAEIMDRQVALARDYGLHGFCYYYYSFSGKRLLEMPLERLLETGRPDFPFCLCWANENWTRRWDGRENDVLMAQNYNDDSDLAIIRDLVRYFRHARYIKINGRPLILVYRVKSLPFFRRTSEIWRNYARAAGIGEICIAMVESFELSKAPENPAPHGCDITVEFPPHEMAAGKLIVPARADPDFTGVCCDYKALAENYMRRTEPGFTRIRSLLVGWDNTPRRQNSPDIFENATPGAFQAWAEWTFRRTREQNFGDERLVFINAWNEWCEGAYLEPDTHFGHGYLEALRAALEGARKPL